MDLKNGARNREIRDWARCNGVYVASRGRLPDQIKRAYAESKRRADRIPADAYGATNRVSGASLVALYSARARAKGLGVELT